MTIPEEFKYKCASRWDNGLALPGSVRGIRRLPVRIEIEDTPVPWDSSRVGLSSVEDLEEEQDRYWKRRDPDVVLRRHAKSRGSIRYVQDRNTRAHIEAQFSDGMGWHNWGEWHIDHIIPVSAFNLKDTEEKDKCFNYRNLRPIWATDNLSKGARIDWLLIESHGIQDLVPKGVRREK